MRKLLILLVLSCSGAYAEPYLIKWDVVGLEDEHVGFAESAPVTSIELETELANEYIIVFGGIRNADGVVWPATGSCYVIFQGFYCELAVRQVTYILTLNERLDGEVNVVDSQGFLIDSGAVSL